MIKIGMLIGDRYEILEKVGTGGMSDVYKAKDHKLNRYVAVKVLKQEFSENANFVSKFRSEAQAAAGLMHPNIVNVYDVGEENAIHYIVMELVEGITLKKYIEKKSRLSVKEAISIAIQISMGIEAAHNNHIIHRDIKPQNVIISKDGKVKVTDFGIAKAATSNTITSNVMGSVHYTSPEQARGGYSDAKSDIYSLGITMFEMLTGRVPFNGETTVSIAIKHIQEPLPSLKEFVPDIPISIEKIIIRCTQKSPDRRYQRMGEVLEDLKHALKAPDEDFVKLDEIDAAGRTKVMTEEDATRPRRKPQRRDGDEPLRLNDNVKNVGTRKNTGKKRPASSGSSSKKDAAYEKKMDHLTTVLAIVAAVLIGCIVLFLAGRALGVFDNMSSLNAGSESTEEVEMPDVVGMSLTRAKSTLTDLGLEFKISYEDSREVNQDVVMASDIEAGKKISVGTTVQLTVSAGTEGVEVTNVTGMTQAEATATLEKAGFQVTVTEAPSADVAKGNVISQTPSGGDKAPLGTTIALTISTGEDGTKVAVPNLLGKTQMEATVILTELGLKVGNVAEVNYEDEAYTGKICAQSVTEGTEVEAGTTIDLQISTGPDNTDISYSYSGSIDSPAAEDPTYVSGSEVTVILTAEDGTELQRTTTSSFPVNINISGIKGSASGLVTLQYVATTAGGTTTDPATGETVVNESTQEARSVQRAVTFTPVS